MVLEDRILHQNTVKEMDLEDIFADWLELDIFNPENKVQKKVEYTLKALQNLISDPMKSKRFTHENVNIFIIFLEAFALEDVELKGIKNELIVKYFGEKDNELIKHVRKCYIHRDEKSILDIKCIKNFVFKETNEKFEAKLFFDSLINYVQGIKDKFEGKDNVNSIDLSKICSKDNIKYSKPKKNENKILDIILKMLNCSISQNLSSEQQEEILYNFIVNVVPLTEGDFNLCDFKHLKSIRNQILHNFHKYEGLHRRFDHLKAYLQKNRNQLFIFYCANKFYDWLLTIKPSEETKKVEESVLDMMKDFDNKIRQFALKLHIRSVFQNEILLTFLVGRLVKKGQGKMILENEHFIYMINKKLLNVKDAAPFLTKLMVVTKNCDSIEPDDLRKLAGTLLEHQEFRFVEHLNDFWHLENNVDLVWHSLSSHNKPKLKLEAAWIISRKIYSTLRQSKQEALIHEGPLPILLHILNANNLSISKTILTVQVIVNLSIGINNLTQQIVECGFVPKFIPLLGNLDFQVQESALNAVANIAAGSDEQRQALIDHNALTYISDLLSNHHEIIREYTVVLLRNIACGNLIQKEAVIQAGLLPILMKFFEAHQTHTSILKHLIWAINNLTRDGNDQIQMIIDCGFVSKLIPLFEHVDLKIQKVALSAAINIAEGSDEQKQVLIDHNVLSYIQSALLHHDEFIRRRTVWLMRNITYGNQIQKEAVIEGGLLPILMKCLDVHQADTNNLRYTVWTIGNLACGDNYLKQKIIDCGFVPKLLPLLKHLEEDVQEVAFYAVANIATGSYEQRQVLIDHNALTYISPLLFHHEENVPEIAMCFFKRLSYGDKEAFVRAGLLPILMTFLEQPTRTNTLRYTVHVIRNLARGDNLKQKIIDCGLVPILIPLLGNVDLEIQKAAFGAAINITCKGSDEQKQVVLDYNALSYIPAALLHEDEIIRECALLFLRNITAHSKFRKKTVIQAGILPILMKSIDLHQTLQSNLMHTAQIIRSLARGENYQS